MINQRSLVCVVCETSGNRQLFLFNFPFFFLGIKTIPFSEDTNRCVIAFDLYRH